MHIALHFLTCCLVHWSTKTSILSLNESNIIHCSTHKDPINHRPNTNKDLFFFLFLFCCFANVSTLPEFQGAVGGIGLDEGHHPTTATRDLNVTISDEHHHVNTAIEVKQTLDCFVVISIKYSGSRLKGLLWDKDKVILITDL